MAVWMRSTKILSLFDDADLRRRLNGNHFAELQVMHFLFKLNHGVFKILHHLVSHRIIGELSIGFQLRNRYFIKFLEFFFARLDVELKLFEVFQVLQTNRQTWPRLS